MRYVVFEAGSRAGLSAKLFFRHFEKVTGRCDHLYLVDSDEVFVESIGTRVENERAVLESIWRESVANGDEMMLDTLVFPADELFRQKGCSLANEWWNSAKPEYYNKCYVNWMMAECGIPVPDTFELSKKIIVKPNSLSAGSKNICFFDDVCVSERIDIAHEYVIDCFVNPYDKSMEIHAREVRLKNGYDKFIKFLPFTHKVYGFVKDIIEAQPVEGMFVGPCHVQVAEDASGMLYYIEGSKRISGTSMVFLLEGYNPFFRINNEEVAMMARVDKEEWYSYEELMQEAWRLVHE